MYNDVQWAQNVMRAPSWTLQDEQLRVCFHIITLFAGAVQVVQLLSTLKDAWKPCASLPFEQDLATVFESELQRRVAEVVQASSDQASVICSNLLTWRNKHLKGVEAGLKQTGLERISRVIEALRAKAYLLFMQQAAPNLNKRQVTTSGDSCGKSASCSSLHGWWQVDSLTAQQLACMRGWSRLHRQASLPGSLWP